MRSPVLSRSGTTGAATRRRVRIALTAWAALIVVAVVWGQVLLPGGTLNLNAPPFAGRFRFAPEAVIAPALLAAFAVVTFPTLARWLPWRLLLPGAVGAAVAWAVSLAYWDGHRAIGQPINRGGEYLYSVPAVGDDPVAFLSTFADTVAVRGFETHVNGHPPLMLLVFWGLDRVGLGGESWAAALVIGAGASAVAAIAVTMRELGDEKAARRALPFLVLAPFALTVATSADAFFLGVSAWVAAALAVGLVRRSWPALLAAGLLAGSLPYLSYGLLPFGSVLLAVGFLAVRRSGRSSGPVALAGSGAFVAGLLAVPIAFTLAGFWWFDGVAATHRAWALGRGDDRPYLYSFLADVAILGVLVGPATVAAAATARRTLSAPLVLAVSALVSVSTLAVSGVTRLEVERIWLPFAPWMVLLTALLVGHGRRWLAANALAALLFQLFVFDIW